ISYDLILPYIEGISRAVPLLLSSGDIITMFIMTVTVVLLPLSMAFFSEGRTIKGQYMSGRPVDAELNFSGSLGRTMHTEVSNYYLKEYFGEEENCKYGIIISVLILAVLAAVLVYTFMTGAVI
ncbi:MAG: NADH-quinone oxidoreductase subunit L, partial [Methanomicrobium sp.]|nr:NADH-quinone oxidoreductase subunit L [Methanomicrobium sp.]